MKGINKNRNIPCFIKADDNKVINLQAILWIKKIDECLEVCTKSIGCDIGLSTHKICKLRSLDGYNKLNALFENTDQK